MPDPTTYHVATSDEVDAMLPPELVRFGNGTEYEPVWMVDEKLGIITYADVVDTARDRWCRIDVVPDPTGGLTILTTDPEWHPLPDPEGDDA